MNAIRNPSSVERRLVCFVAAMLIGSYAAYGHNDAVGIAFPAKGITVDGDLGDWPAGLRTYPIERIESGDKPRGKDDLEAHFRLAYNPAERSLYVAVEVRDDSVVLDGPGEALWNTRDGCEIFVDASHVSVADKDKDGSFSWAAWGSGTQKLDMPDRCGEALLVAPGTRFGEVSGIVAWKEASPSAVAPGPGAGPVDSLRPQLGKVRSSTGRGLQGRDPPPPAPTRSTPWILPPPGRLEVTRRRPGRGRPAGEGRPPPRHPRPLARPDRRLGRAPERRGLQPRRARSRRADLSGLLQDPRDVAGRHQGLAGHLSSRVRREERDDQGAGDRGDGVRGRVDDQAHVLLHPGPRPRGSGVLDLDTPSTPICATAPSVPNCDERYQLMQPRMVLTYWSGFPNWRTGKLEIGSVPGTQVLLFRRGVRLSRQGGREAHRQEAGGALPGRGLRPVDRRCVLVWNEQAAHGRRPATTGAAAPDDGRSPSPTRPRACTSTPGTTPSS